MSKPVPVPKDELDALQVLVWFEVVRYGSGLPSAYAIEMKIDGGKIRQSDGITNRPRKWEGYATGRTKPKDNDCERNSIEAGESIARGSARWFRSVLWQLLRHPDLAADRIIAELESLPEDSRMRLLEDDHGQQVPLHQINAGRVSQLLDVDVLSFLEACMLLIVLSAMNRRYEQYATLVTLYDEKKKLIANLPHVIRHSKAIIDKIDRWCYTVSETHNILRCQPNITETADAEASAPPQLEHPTDILMSTTADQVSDKGLGHSFDGQTLLSLSG